MAGSSKSLGPAWRLSTTLSGHSMDVRAVGAAPEGCIITGSRDRTAKLWHPEGVKDFSAVVTYKGHDNFVASVCYLPPCNTYPEGLILTASNDKTICGYNIEEPMPVVTLKGHENTVCCVTVGHIPGMILSSSWDSTGRVWSVDQPEKSLQILKGHQAVVWGIVELGNHNIATASADKTIIVWTPDGKKVKTLTGHTDCIRALTVASPETFLSCANDASIRLWTNHGECINTFFGHTNYIYSICTNPSVDNQCFVTCGEDSTVRVWSGGDNICTITLPAQTVWSVASMSNGDIVAGSSDGLVRVFTRDHNRQADETALKQFEEEVVKLHEASAQEIGGFKVTDLPGPEVLFEPGKTDGQTKLVRTGTKVKCYSWDAANQKWNEVGDVMGSAGPTEGKTIHQGKEYDFVFSVDIEDGKPPLKLPYNMNQDPWTAAQEFIHKNQLPQSYLEQVANFIITNSNKGNNEPVRDSNYMDPFTGGSRYVPTGNSSANSKANNVIPAQDRGSNSFPQKTYLRFDKADYSVILEKLKEFNMKLPDKCFQVNDADLEAIIALAGQKSTYNPEIANNLKNIIKWPQGKKIPHSEFACIALYRIYIFLEFLFPALDVTRLTIRNENVNKDLFDSRGFGPIIMKILLENLGPGNIPANQLLTLRVLVNAFAHKQGEYLVLNEHESILNILICLENFNKNIQIAVATLLLNLSIALGKETNSIILCQCLLEISTKFSENEAHFRTLVALGTLIMLAPTRTDITTIISMHSEFMKQLQLYSTYGNDKDLMKQKVAGYSRQILELL